MRILVLGGDGYLGWPTALHFSQGGHDVGVVDNLVRRHYDDEMGSNSLVPIRQLHRRVATWKDVSGHTDRAVHRRPERLPLHFRDDPFVRSGRGRPLRRAAQRAVLDDRPEARGVHPGEQRRRARSTCSTRSPSSIRRSTSSSSARWASTARRTSTSKRASSRSPTRAGPTSCPTRSSRAPSTTCPRCTTATTSSSPAESGACARRTSTRASSTGSRRPRPMLHPDLATRFDYDGVFGTVLNRFAVQAAVGYPLTVYGKGGQTRGMLDIRDTLACVELACLNPAAGGRVPCLQPVHRVVLGEPARRVGQASLARPGHDRVDPGPPRREGRALLQRDRDASCPTSGCSRTCSPTSTSRRSSNWRSSTRAASIPRRSGRRSAGGRRSPR